MKIKYILLALLCLFINNSFAKEPKTTDSNVFGHVLDKITQEHLPFVTLQLEGTSIGTATDESGHYFLKH